MRTLPTRPVPLASIVAFAAAAGLTLAGPAAASASPTLQRGISDAFSGSTAHDVHFNVEIGGGPTLARHPTSRSRPASNEKLLTTQTLLAEVGPGFRYDTRAYLAAPLGSGGVEHGDLVVVGGGDPTLTTAGLGRLGERLHAAGLRRVTGNLVVDDSRYDHATRAPGWKRHFLPDQTGPVDAFSVDSDADRRGPAYLADPTRANTEILRTALARAHITVVGSDRTGQPPAGAKLVQTVQSRPLSAIVRETLRISDNFNAEMMLREAGYQHSGRGTRTTGIAAIRAEASALHVRLGRIEDGSGLSYRDAESPAVLTDWLRAIQHASTFPTVYASVPTSCRTGTLKFRLCGAHVSGRVHAKTGTLDHDVALSGWTHTRSGRLVTFSFLLSRVRSTGIAEAHLDAAVSRLARYR